MPWNNQNGGPWGQHGGGTGGGSGGGGPWGGGPRNGSTPPDLDRIIRRGQDRLRDMFPDGGGFGFGRILVIVVLAVAVWLATGFYTVSTNEVGIELVFGRFISKTNTNAGLQYNWPYPIGTVVKLDVTEQRTITVGYTNNAAGRQPVLEEALMLTGDDNVVF
ncbi:MAG: protease modulator HflK, partial [Methylobacteriaceae bacterium]|nr:protease modulator HflK [Methylobacteriaceae bacterium]